MAVTHPVGMKENRCGGVPRDIGTPLDTILLAKVTLVTGSTIGLADGGEHEAVEEADGTRTRKTKKSTRRIAAQLHRRVTILGLMDEK